MSVVGLALGAALCLGLAAVLQQRAAAEVPAGDAIGPQLALNLIRRKIWLAGIVLMLAGYALQALALASGALALVEPVLAASVLFGLPISAAWLRQRLQPRDWLAALAAVAGIGGFLYLAHPSGGVDNAPLDSWWLAILSLVLTGLVTVSLGLWRGSAARALGMAAAGGLALGLADAITKPVIHNVEDGPAALFLSWQLYSLVLVGVVGFWLVQHAYQAGHLARSLPTVTVLEPLTGSLLGIVLFSEHVRLSAIYVSLETLALTAAITGVFLLAGSPLGRSMPYRQHPRMPVRIVPDLRRRV